MEKGLWMTMQVASAAAALRHRLRALLLPGCSYSTADALPSIDPVPRLSTPLPSQISRLPGKQLLLPLRLLCRSSVLLLCGMQHVVHAALTLLRSGVCMVCKWPGSARPSRVKRDGQLLLVMSC